MFIRKAEILARVDEITIFALGFRLLGLDHMVNEDTIAHCINTNDTIRSPFRDDNGPSMGFMQTHKRLKENRIKGVDSGSILCRDFAVSTFQHPLSPYFYGDCFDLMAKVLTYDPVYVKDTYDFPNALTGPTFLNLDPKIDKAIRSQALMIVLKEIIYQLKLDTNVVYTAPRTIRFIKPLTTRYDSNTAFKFIRRFWNEEDEKYWKPRGLSSKQLEEEFIYPVDELYFSRGDEFYLAYRYVPGVRDICYFYALGEFYFKEGLEFLCEVYFPLRKKTRAIKRFMSNIKLPIPLLTSFWFDKGRTYPADILVLTKSSKDRTCLIAKGPNNESLYFNEQEIILRRKGKLTSDLLSMMVAFVKNEAVKFTPRDMDIICANYYITVFLFDYDLAGIRLANNLRKLFKERNMPVIILFFRDTKTKTGKKIKDFSDHVYLAGIPKTKELVNSIVATYKTRISDYIRSKKLHQAMSGNSVNQL